MRVHGGLARSPLVSRKEGRQYSLLPVIHRTRTCTTRLFSHRPAFQASSKRHKGKNCGLGLSSPLPPFLGEDSPAILGVLGGEWWWWRPSGELAASPPPAPTSPQGTGKGPKRNRGSYQKKRNQWDQEQVSWGQSVPPRQQSKIFTKNLLYNLLNYPSEDSLI